MKIMSFFSGVLAALAISSAASAGSSPPPVPNPLPGSMGGTGGGFYTSPVVNSSAAASANQAGIYTALTNFGHAIVDCNGTVWINSTIYLKSSQKLDISPGCALEATSGTGTLVANYASSPVNVPWAVTQLNTSISNGPLSAIWSGSLIAYSNSLTVTVGQYITNSLGIWYVRTAGTTASSGSGPTASNPTLGTTASDGTATFSFVTTNYASPNNTALTFALYWPSHGRTSGDAAWVSPEPDSFAPVAWTASTTYTVLQLVKLNGNLYIETNATGVSGSTGPTGTSTSTDGTCAWQYLGAASSPPLYYSGTESGTIAGAYTDPAFFGVFTIYNASDPNWVWLIMRQQPGTAYTGAPLLVKQADQNFSFGGGGTLNYNAGTNAPISVNYTVGGTTYSTNTSSQVSGMTTVWAGAKDFKITGYSCVNTYKYCADFNGIANAVIDGVHGSCYGMNSDLLKFYGPATDTYVSNISGCAADDEISLQPIDAAQFTQYMLASGSILGFHATHIIADKGLAISLYKNENVFQEDEIYFDDIKPVNIYPGARSPFAFYNANFTAAPTATIGQVHVRGIASIAAAEAFMGCYGANLNVTQLTVDDFNSNLNVNPALNTNATGALLNCNSSTTTFNQVVVNNPKAYFGNLYPDGLNAPDALVRLPAGSIKSLIVNNPMLYSSSSTTNYGNLAYLGSGWGTIPKIMVTGGTFTGVNVIRTYSASDIYLQGITFQNPSGQGMYGVGVNANGVRVHACGNALTNLSYGLVRANGSYTFELYSCGDNSLSGGSYMYSPALGSPTPILYNVVDAGRQGSGLGTNGIPIVSSCGSGAALSSTADSYNGSVTIPSGTTTCTYTVPANAWPQAPRNCQVTPQGAAILTAVCSTAFTNLNASTNSFTITLSSNSSGVTVGYSIN